MLKSLIAAFLCLALFAPAPAFAAWAVALGSTGGPYVTRYTLPDEARAGVLADCKKAVQNCHVVASGDSGCVAMATTGTRWGVGTGSPAKRADAAALAACTALGAGQCKVVHDFCGR
jgi:hypothetical protein